MSSLTIRDKCHVDDGTITNKTGGSRIPDPNMRTQVVIHIYQGNVNNPATYVQESIRLLLPVDMYVIQMVSMIREQLCKNCFNHELVLNIGRGAMVIRMTSKLIDIPAMYRNTDGAIHFSFVPPNTFGGSESSESSEFDSPEEKAEEIFNLDVPGFWHFLEPNMEEKDVYSGLLDAPIGSVTNIAAHLGMNFQKMNSTLCIKDAFVVLPSVSIEGKEVHFLDNGLLNVPLHPTGLTIHLPCLNGTIQSLHPRPSCFSSARQYEIIVDKVDEIMGLLEVRYDWCTAIPVDLLVELERPFVLIDFLAFCEEMQFPIHVYEVNF